MPNARQSLSLSPPVLSLSSSIYDKPRESERAPRFIGRSTARASGKREGRKKGSEREREVPYNGGAGTESERCQLIGDARVFAGQGSPRQKSKREREV